MKTELLHSYSSASLSNLSRSPSVLSINSKGSNASQNYQTERYATLGADNLPKQDAEQDGCCQGWLKKAFTKKSVAKKFPIINWLPEYNASKIVCDLIAGLTVGLTLIPQGLAMASVANLPPQYGLYSGFIGCFVYILIGSTKEITIGPTAIMAIITLTYSEGKPPEYAVLLCFLTGVVTLLMGLLQLGFITNFLSNPVVSGFTSAAAIQICFTQIKALLGLKFPSGQGFIEVTKGVIMHISELNVEDLLVSIICIIVLLFLRKLQSICKCASQCSTALDKVLWVISTSRSVIVIVVCTIVFAMIGQEDLVAFVGDVVPGLPKLSVPPFSFDGNGTQTTAEILPEWETFTLIDLLKNDASALLVLPLLALMEHITSAKMFAGTGRVDASQEMIAIGVSNILGSFMSSMPITGAFSRTVVNKSSGVESPLGGLVTGILVIVALQFLTPYFFFIPKAALAAVICCAVIFTVDLEIVYPMWRSKKMDLLPWFATFSISLLVGLEIGVLVGFMISVIFLMYYAARPGVRVNKGQTSTGIEFILIDLDRSLTFPSVEYTRYILMKSGTKWAHGSGSNSIPMVVNCSHIQFADFTAAQGIRDLFKLFNEKKHELILYQLKPSIVRIFTSVMELNGVPFKYCSTEMELEEKLEAYMQAKVDKNNVKITFTVADDDDDDDDNMPPFPVVDDIESNQDTISPVNRSNNGHVNQGAVFTPGQE